MISSFNVPTLTPHVSPLPLSKGRGKRNLHIPAGINGDYPRDSALGAYYQSCYCSCRR